MSTKPAPKTILLIMVDQLAAKWLEVARQGVVQLPNFDALQNAGVTFENAFTNNPVCSPARASIATGIGFSGHGVTECGYELDSGIPTFMQGLQASGFRTGAFGKLHFLPQMEGVAPDYKPYGFDVTHITEDSRAGEWLDWVGKEYPEHYQAAQSTVWMTMIDELERYGPEEVNLKEEILEAQRQYPESTTEAYELPFPAEVSQTAWITDRACEFLREQDESRDLFAQISYVQPHNPFAPPAEFVDRVEASAIPDPVPADWVEYPIRYYQQARYAQPSYDVEDWKRQRQLYFADLAHLDHELGRILKTLETSGRAGNAYIVFTSDHGELLHDHGLLGKWERHYDACIRVPLIVSGPGIVPGNRDELVDHTDIAPSIYRWAGVTPPTLPQRSRSVLFQTPMLMGSPLGELLEKDQDPQWRQAIFVQSNGNHADATPSSWARTIRTKRYRYTRHLAQGGEQLFDLDADPNEQTNLAENPEMDSTKLQLLGQLAELMATDAFPNSPRDLYQIGSW